MPPTFETLSTPHATGDRRYSITFPDGWQQGRGAFGGLVLAPMARAVELFAATPERALRTLTAELCGPVLPGPAEIVVEPLRIGNGTSTLAARLLQAGEVQAHAVVVLGRHRDVPGWDGLPRPAMPAWSGVPIAPPRPHTAQFARQLEYRPTGPVPFAGSGDARAAGWVRFVNPGARRDGAFLVAMADAYWPALFGVLDAPRPMATITFTVDVVGTCDGLDPEAPLFHESRTLASHAGFAPELRTLWGADGRLLAINHQTFVIIK